MQTSQDQVKILNELGLTFCEARVYLALAQTGPCSARTISKTSNVSKPDVYRALETLQARGLVEKILSSPNLFKELGEGNLSILLKKKDLAHHLLREKAKQLEDDLKNNMIKEPPLKSEPQFILISGKEAELYRKRKETRGAQKSIDVINSLKKFPRTQFFCIGETREALQRGVKVRVITERVKYLSKIFTCYGDFRKDGSYRLRCLSSPLPITFAIYDGRRLLMSTSSTANLGEASNLWSNNEPIVDAMQEYFEMIWAKAEQCNAL
jgi:sugar-specific transcriptional regulator TrmB